ncbi:GAF domain protein [Methyloversatilis sp. RAC08]|uniref:HD domain-containing phosphohydrolase n=1 Tax=Methyloversatilis sp. RAC08 TaxID=1842540 RepID=UPI00083D93E7|nr:HD domain-containing phosphohydrolase [Methyloversatilis sp. RAC08]AOF82940.1 GAF domain protein [Methyloversatilis sp. RAC08]
MNEQHVFEGTDNAYGTSLSEQMKWLHEHALLRHPEVHRIAIALYDARHELLKTYVNSSDVQHPMSLYQKPLAASSSLTELATRHSTRVISDLASLPEPHAEHTRWLLEHGYRSSFTVPLFQSGVLFGFVFFDSRAPGAFDGALSLDLQIYVQLCRMSVLNVINLSHAVEGMVKVARGLAHLRDIETGRHLDRMSSYSRLIARGVSDHFGFGDEFIEHVYLFSPLHDIGKVGIADSILLKPGKLTDEEREIMKGHVDLGVQLVDEVMQDAGLGSTEYVSVMRNVVRCHHEFMDGSGYPRGLSGEALPVEGRIVTIADIFDALTTERPYKKPWSNEDALAELHRMRDAGKLDPRCVAALEDSGDEVRAIQQKFGLNA